ncbi:MAG: hypothetical protein J7M13_00980 [Synergistetes bacterium]|nr:hypothetical protein [Synergistota bacterium]
MISVAFWKKLEGVDPKLRGLFLSLIEEIEHHREESVTKKEFRELIEAQRRTEEAINKLAEAQKKTEEEIAKLTKRMDTFEERLAKLEEAQIKTEERLAKLEETVNKLAEAQRKTEEEIAKLTQRMSAFEKRLEKVEERLEGISNSVGYSLENSAYKALPKLLVERFGIKIKDRLIRRYISIRTKEVQVNIYGEAKKNGSEILILGECKVRPSKKEIARFEKHAKQIARHTGKEVFLIMVAHDFSPVIEELLKEKGIAYFWSYEL